jgi:hypothetical protein
MEKEDSKRDLSEIDDAGLTYSIDDCLLLWKYSA